MSARAQSNARRNYPIGSLLPDGQSAGQRPRYQAPAAPSTRPYAALQSQHVQHDPWPEVERLASGAVEASGRFFSWGRRTTSAWASRTSSLWARPGRGSKAMAIACALAGVVALLLFAYVLIYLIPILILAAFVAAVLAAVKGRN